jgi:hypothetical protein
MPVINTGPTWAATQTDDVTPIEFLTDAQIAAGNYRLLEREPWYMRAAGSVGVSDIGELTAIGYVAGQTPRWDGSDFLPADYYTEAEVTALIANFITQAQGDARYGQLGAANTWTLAQTFTGQVLAAAGSLGAPGISFSADTNTGFRRSAEDTLTVVTGGATRASFDTASATFTYAITFNVTDAATNSATNLIDSRHNSSGTPLAGFGSRYLSRLKSSTTNNIDAAEYEVLWNDPTHASYKADMLFRVYDAGGGREFLRGRATGAAAAIGFLGKTPVVRQIVSAAATDPASTQTLVNDIRTALINLGLVA